MIPGSEAAQNRGHAPVALRSPAMAWLLDPRVVFAAYIAGALAVTWIKLAPGEFTENGHRYQPLQNFAIFRNAFFHIIQGRDLYAPYPDEQWDLYRYSPAFALLFAPFSALPYAAGVLVWNAVNAIALVLAILWAFGPHTVVSAGLPPRSRGVFAAWFVFLAMLNAAGNAQSNAFMAALMLGAWSAGQRKRPWLAALLVVLSVYIKLFGIFALIPCLLAGRRRALLAWTAAWGALLGALPLIVVSPAHLAALYRNWYGAVRAFNESRLGLSVMGWLDSWFGLRPPSNLVVALGACVLVAMIAIAASRGAWRDARIGLLATAAVLIYVTIFNYAAESPSYVIAVTGCALWYFSQRPTVTNSALLVAVFFLSELSSSSLFSQPFRHDFMEPYTIKAVPCIAVWCKVLWDVSRFASPPAKQA